MPLQARPLLVHRRIPPRATRRTLRPVWRSGQRPGWRGAGCLCRKQTSNSQQTSCLGSPRPARGARPPARQGPQGHRLGRSRRRAVAFARDGRQRPGAPAVAAWCFCAPRPLPAPGQQASLPLLRRGDELRRRGGPATQAPLPTLPPRRRAAVLVCDGVLRCSVGWNWPNVPQLPLSGDGLGQLVAR